MSNRQDLLHELEQAPDDILDEISDFYHFLKIKSSNETLETLILSESSLKKDWLTPEEDKAWQNL